MADDDKDDETISLNIVHHFPEDSRLTFCDNVAIQHTQNEFTITFAQVRQPIVANAEEYEKIDHIRADVVARIVLTPPKMVEFIKSLQENWGIYQRRMKAVMGARANAATDKTSDSSPSED